MGAADQEADREGRAARRRGYRWRHAAAPRLREWPHGDREAADREADREGRASRDHATEKKKDAETDGRDAQGDDGAGRAPQAAAEGGGIEAVRVCLEGEPDQRRAHLEVRKSAPRRL